MLELNFTQTLGSHCLTLNETLPASGITAGSGPGVARPGDGGVCVA